MQYHKTAPLDYTQGVAKANIFIHHRVLDGSVGHDGALLPDASYGHGNSALSFNQRYK
jgi:hypothetical protein